MHHDDGNDGDGDGDDGDGDGDGDAGDGDDGASADDDDLTVCRTSSILRISDWMSSRLALKFSRVCGKKELRSFQKTRKGRRR